MLPKDYEEFSHLVPQSGIWMRLKAVIEKYSHGCSYGFEVSEKVNTIVAVEIITEHVKVSISY